MKLVWEYAHLIHVLNSRQSSLHWFILGFLYALCVQWSIIATIKKEPLFWALKEAFHNSNTLVLRILHIHLLNCILFFYLYNFFGLILGPFNFKARLFNYRPILTSLDWKLLYGTEIWRTKELILGPFCIRLSNWSQLIFPDPIEAFFIIFERLSNTQINS